MQNTNHFPLNKIVYTYVLLYMNTCCENNICIFKKKKGGKIKGLEHSISLIQEKNI